MIRFTIDQEGEIDWIEPDSIRDPESYVIDEGHHYDWASESWTSGKAEIRYQRRSPLYYD